VRHTITQDIEGYERFLRIKALPAYRFVGRTAEYPDEYERLISGESIEHAAVEYQPIPGLFDYQTDIVRLALQKKRFAVFADCGLGKTLIFLEWVRTVRQAVPKWRKILIVSPLMVIPQTLAEVKRWYGGSLDVQQIHASQLAEWLASRTKDAIGITNYDALVDGLPMHCLGALVLDESSMLKSHYGKWAGHCMKLGAGLTWKLCLTGTPAPNDRIEYANHAVFLDAFPTVNSFLARFFVNRGQTCERWELKAHALKPFYRALSHWSIFLVNPGRYGWKHNAEALPLIHVHLHDVPLTDEQVEIGFTATGRLFYDTPGGINGRSIAGQLSKGRYKGEDVDTHKPGYIRKLVDSFGDESTIIWCLYNAEQDLIAEQFPDAANISGDTPLELRLEAIERFKSGECKVLISKPKILGFGLNLQIATRQVFSGLQDSYESFYQAVKRSNRYGASSPLHVHIPLTDLERPMVENVLRKAKMVHQDTEEQERIFYEQYRSVVNT
jgi:hypothetical protein